MPTTALKNFAKKSHIKLGRAEHLWAKAKEIVSTEYHLSHEDPKYWALVMGITKRMMGINENERITFKTFISESTLTTLYHGGNHFEKWDPSTIGNGEGMGFLALGPGLYAGNTPSLARNYKQFSSDGEGTITELLVDTHNFFDPRKKTPAHLEAALETAIKKLDKLGLRASTRPFKDVLRQASRSQWQSVRAALVDSGIDGIWEVIDDGLIEYCIYNPEAIKKISKFEE